MHINEAISLFATQAQIAIHEGDLTAAQNSLDTLRRFAADDHWLVIETIEAIEELTLRLASKRKGLFR